MKTKVLVNNKSRIRKGLEPIQPAVTIARFSITELSEAEREWIASHYNDEEDSVYMRNVKNAGPSDLLFVEDAAEKEVIEAIRAAISEQEHKRQYAAGRKKKA